jgi:hypothetical protein
MIAVMLANIAVVHSAVVIHFELQKFWGSK